MVAKVKEKRHVGIVIVFGCLVYALSAGIRSNYGIMMNGLIDKTQLTYEQISFVMGIGQLSYGFAQPVFGYIAMKKSNKMVILTGILLMTLGLFLTPLSTSLWSLILSLGILLSVGTGVLCFGIIMGLISPFLERGRAARVSGILNASSGIGSSMISPIVESLIAAFGILGTMWTLGGLTLALLPMSFWIFSKLLKNNGEDIEEQTKTETTVAPKIPLKKIFKDRNYQYLLLGFGTCGFHMAIIQTHFYSQVVSYGVSEQMAALAYTAFGIASMVGSIICGILCSKFQLKNVLASLYGIRALIVVIFILFLPKNTVSVFIFAIVLGMSGDATVTPTSEIISHQYGIAQMSFLFGITYVSHQIGSFISAWLGGIFVTGSGDYHAVWLLDVVLCFGAFVVSYLIKNKQVDTVEDTQLA